VFVIDVECASALASSNVGGQQLHANELARGTGIRKEKGDRQTVKWEERELSIQTSNSKSTPSSPVR
jgi:hypothetical protein